MSEWQDISTAPKDGSKIVCCVKDTDLVEVSRRADRLQAEVERLKQAVRDMLARHGFTNDGLCGCESCQQARAEVK